MAGSSGLDRAAWDELMQTVGGDRDFLAELLQTFLDDTSHQLAVLGQSLERGQAEGFRRAAHSLKSNCATFGARQLSEMFRELEMLASGGSLDGAAERVMRAEEEYRRIRPLLEAERQRL